MNSLVSSVENIKNEINQFIKELFGKAEWDVLVPILRKGRIVLLSTVQDFAPRIRLPPFYGLDQIGNKKVLILDDKAMHGHTMKNIHAQVLSAGVPEKNVKTAVFVKNKACDYPINYYYHELEGMEYDKKESDLALYYESVCLQLDADHLVAKSIVTGNSLDTQIFRRFPKAVEQCSSDVGIFYLQHSIARFWGREKFAIADIPLSKLNIDYLDKLITEEGVQKLRFCLEPCGELLIMPIFYPQINVNNEVCKEALDGRTKFCEQILREVPRTTELCRECIDFNLQASALVNLSRYLMERLRKAEYNIHVNSLIWPELEYKYPNFKTILEHVLKEVRGV
jgi:hypothetical protein